MMHRQTILLSIMFLAIAGCSAGESDTSAPALSGPVASAPEVPEGDPYDPGSATARLSGSVRFDGTPPEMPFLEMGSDFYCNRNAIGTRDEEVLVTDDGLLSNVIVYVRSGHDDQLSYAAPTEPVLLDQERCVYDPRGFTIMTRQELRVRNSDGTLHNVHSQSQIKAPFNFAQSSRDGEESLSFAEPEMPISIGCDLHRWMTTFVGVFDHPFHTTTADTGSFELTVPPGTYEIVAWHELYGEQTPTVEVADNEAIELDFTFSE